MPSGVYPRTQLPAIERFLNKIEIGESGCWEWRAGLFGVTGYACFWDGTRRTSGHRWSYQWFLGKIPIGLEIDHLCRNRKCVNPDHLEIVTCRENILRGLAPAMARQRQKNKTHCRHGHPFDRVNTFPRPGGNRGCRTCKLESSRRYEARHIGRKRIKREEKQ